VEADPLTRSHIRISRPAYLLVPAALLGIHWFVDGARPFRAATRLADFAIDFAIAVWIATAVHGRLRNAMISVASVLLCLTAAEGYALSVLAGGPTHLHTPGHYVFDPVMGWRAGHPGVFHHTRLAEGAVVFDVDYTIDEHRNRQVVSAADGPTVAFFGDSFTFGEGLPDADTLPQLFADLTGRKSRVLNLGGTGYGPQQFLRPLETGLFDDLLTEARAFVFQTAPWHADRAACESSFIMPAARYTLSGGRPVYRGRCADRWWPFLDTVLTMSMYRTYLEPAILGPSPAKLDLYTAILARAAEIGREKYHVPTVILYVPDDTYLRDSGYSDEQIRQKLRDAGLTVIDGRLDPAAFPGQKLKIEGDGHPTGVANRARAALVRDAIAEIDAPR
jgi:hypothetical protein